jgi:hypothetical protein
MAHAVQHDADRHVALAFRRMAKARNGSSIASAAAGGPYLASTSAQPQEMNQIGFDFHALRGAVSTRCTSTARGV